MVDHKPYIGLRAFRREDQPYFFGRESEAREVASLWNSSRLTVLYGASGVGKTSLLHAGVIPAQDPDRVEVLPVGRVGPIIEPPSGGNPFTHALLSSWATGEETPAQDLESFFASRPVRTDRYGDPIPTLIAIDQAEEIFLDFPRFADERAAFLAELAAVLHDRPALRLLLSLREDHLGYMLRNETTLGQGARSRFHLRPFTRSAALLAASRPLELTGREFAAGAAEALVDDLRTVVLTDEAGGRTVTTVDTVEPVQLQIVCLSLWDSLPDNVRTITSWHVREHADVDGFLARFCGRALAEIARAHDTSVAELRRWLQRHLITELGTRGVVHEGFTATAGMPNAVVRALEDHHILRAERQRGSRWYELQHDRLIEPLRQADPQEYLDGALQALAESDLALAERQARQALRGEGDDLRTQALAKRILGDVAARQGHLDQAQTSYRDAAVLFEVLGDKTAVGTLLGESGRLSLRQGKPGAAVEELRAAISRIPSDLGIRASLARALWHAGNPHTARIVLGEQLGMDDQAIEARQVRGEILADEIEQGTAEEALADLDLARRNQGPETLAARALALARTGRLDAAEDTAADARANTGDSGPVFLRLARVYEILDRPQDAAEFAERALAASAPRLPPHLRPDAVRLTTLPR